MTTAAAIDRDILNELFDNQKKFDDIFGSIFDDDSSITGSTPVNKNTHGGGASALDESQQDYSYEDLSFDTDAGSVSKTNTSMFYLVLPVVAEVAAILYGIYYFL